MKYIAIIFFSFLSFCSFGQSKQRIKLEFNKSDFEFSKDSTQLFIRSLSNIYRTHPDFEKPAWPYLSLYVLIDPNTEYKSHKSSFSMDLFAKDVILAKNPMPIPTYSNINNKHNSVSSFSSESNYPKYAVEYTGTHSIGNYKFLSFLVCPFQYNTDSSLYLFRNVELDVELVQASVSSRLLCSNNSQRAVIENLVHNPQDLSTLYPNVDSSRSNLLTTNSSDYQFDYLIISNNALRSELQKLANWKTIKGIRTTVETVENIYSSTSGASNQERIKTYIKNLYNNSNGRLKYVLLAGDNTIVPTQTCYVECTAINGLHTANIACDLYYACLSDINWDTNNNGKAGEPTDNIDINSDIIVTRLSVKNVLDARTQINRIIKYEQGDSYANWNTNILMGGTTLKDSLQYYSGVLMSDTHYKGELFFNNYINPYWPSANKYLFYDTGTSFIGGAAYDFRTQHCLEQFSRGYSFINIITHGDFDNYKMEYRGDSIPSFQIFNNSNARSVANTGNTIITTTSCKTNGFNVRDTCLSEAFMRNPDGGIIGYYGCSDNGWSSSSMTSLGVSDIFNGEFYKQLLQNTVHQLGKSVYDSKSNLVSSCRSQSPYRWVYFGLNALCDPEMSVFISQPLKFWNVNITYNHGNVYIGTGINDCKICITSLYDYGTSLFQTVEGVNGCTFNLPAGVYRICITKSGYIPYIAYVGDNIYIQNENFTKNTQIHGENIYIGSHVTTIKEQGPVLVLDGETDIKCSNKTTIKNYFKVKKGASLKVQ